MNIKRIIITNLTGKVVYKGALSNFKFKHERIKAMCIELFNDENPCIIHESYAIEHLATSLEKVLLNLNQTTLIIDEALILLCPDIDLKPYLGFNLSLEVKP